MKIVIIDYGIGNVQSIYNILKKVTDNEILLSNIENDILNADGIILPGVGAYKKAMEELKKRNLHVILTKYLKMEKPLLGICLGMQLLFESSEEFGQTKGLNFVDGKVIHFPTNITDKIPHISWNELHKAQRKWDKTILNNIQEKENFYFVHSYICQPKNKDIVLSTTEYGGIKFCSSIQYKNIYATQFHPEKSAKAGIQVISNFINIVKNR